MPIRKIQIATNKKTKTAKRSGASTAGKRKMPVVKKPSGVVSKSTKKPVATAARKHPKQAIKPIKRVAEQMEEQEPFQETVAETTPVVHPVVDAGGAVIMTPVAHDEHKA